MLCIGGLPAALSFNVRQGPAESAAIATQLVTQNRAGLPHLLIGGDLAPSSIPAARHERQALLIGGAPQSPLDTLPLTSGKYAPVCLIAG